MKAKKVIHIDMDNTICDFKTPYLADKLKGWNYPQAQYGFFRNLKPIEGALEAIAILKLHFEVHIVTRPSVYNPLCYTEKRLWVEDHLGIEMCDYLTLTGHKHKFIGDYLIDDTLWPGFVGQQILFGSYRFYDWTSVLDYILTEEGIYN